MLEWTKELSVEVPEMDQQHQRWIQLINQLDQAMIQGTGNETIDQVAEELQAFSRRHFAEEEALMERHGYPELNAHKAVHRDFLSQLDQISQTASLKSFKTSQVLKLMQGWLVQHVTQEDKRYGRHING